MLVDGARSLHILFCEDPEKSVLVWEQVAKFFKEKLVSACVEMEVTMGSLKTIDRDSLEYKLKLYFKPYPISEANDENVKIVVGNKFDGTVLDEWENVPLEIYAPWCGHCQFIMKLTYKKLVSAILFIDFHHLTEKSLLGLEEFSNARIITIYDSSNFGDQWEQSCEEDSIEITMKSCRKSIFRQIVKTALQEVASVEIQLRAANLWTFCFNICHDEWRSCLLYMKMDIISEVITMLIMVLCRFLLNFLDVLSPQFGCSDVGYECILWGFYSGGYIGSFCGGLIMNDALVHLSVDLALRKGKFEKLCSGTENCLLAGALEFKWTKVEAKFAPTAAAIFFEKELFRACEGGQIIIDYINETCDSNLGKYTALAIKEAFSFKVRVKLRREDLLNPLDTAPSTICVIGLGSDEVQLLGDLANEDVDEANRVQIANYLCISYHAISEGMIGIEAFEAKEKLYFDILGMAQRVDSYSYQLITNILSTSGKLDNIILTGDGAVDDKVTDLVFLADCISKFLKFSLPRPPEIADLEDKEMNESLEDAGNESILADEKVIRYQIGEVFVHLSSDEVETRIEKMKEETSKNLEKLEEEKESVVAQMAELKKILYGKFKDSINLGEQAENHLPSGQFQKGFKINVIDERQHFVSFGIDRSSISDSFSPKAALHIEDFSSIYISLQVG
ncbi:unnamed protein product [Rhodiola kirilowii]